jgi:hypothetical protein
MKVIAVAWAISLVLVAGLSWHITRLSIKPERVVVTQEKIIYRLQKDLEIQKVKAEVRYLVRVPFTDMGITLEHVQGFIGGIVAGAIW